MPPSLFPSIPLSPVTRRTSTGFPMKYSPTPRFNRSREGFASVRGVGEFSPRRGERHRLLIIVNGFINNRSCRSSRRRRVNIARRGDSLKIAGTLDPSLSFVSVFSLYFPLSPSFRLCCRFLFLSRSFAKPVPASACIRLCPAAL